MPCSALQRSHSALCGACFHVGKASADASWLHTHPRLPAGAFAVSPVSESRVGARALQIAAGCPRAVYWAGSYAWDATMYLGVVAFALATFAAFGDGATTGSAAKLLATALLLLGYGLAAIPQAYLYSLRFSSPSSAQVAVSAVSFLLGFMLVVGSQTMQGIPEAQVGLRSGPRVTWAAGQLHPVVNANAWHG